jgi:hypothetical protein
LNRDDALNLLKEIMSDCESFRFAQAVSISLDKKSQRWVLSAKWVRPESEKTCLDNIIVNRGVEVLEKDGYTVFRKLN